MGQIDSLVARVNRSKAQIFDISKSMFGLDGVDVIAPNIVIGGISCLVKDYADSVFDDLKIYVSVDAITSKRMHIADIAEKLYEYVLTKSSDIMTVRGVRENHPWLVNGSVALGIAIFSPSMLLFAKFVYGYTPAVEMRESAQFVYNAIKAIPASEYALPS